MTTRPMGQAAPLPAQPQPPAAVEQVTSTALAVPAELAGLAPTDDELAGIRADMDRIKMPGSGGLSWEIPGDDPSRPTMVPELRGTILYSHQASALWLDTQNANGEKPDAYSRDGIHQEVNPDSREKHWPLGPPAALLSECPYNRFGSDPKGGRGKWTKNMRRLYFLPEGELVPVIITLSPTGLKPYSNFYAKKVQGRGLVLPALEIAIGLKRVEGGGNIYSVPTFEVIGPVTQDRVHAILESRQMVMDYARSAEIGADDYDVRETEPTLDSRKHEDIDIPMPGDDEVAL